MMEAPVAATAWVAMALLAMGVNTLSAAPYGSGVSLCSVRVMTYNVHAWRDSDHICNFDRVADVVRRADPDVLCLNEVLHPFVRPAWDDGGREYYDAVRAKRGRGVTPPPSSRPRSEADAFLPRLARSAGLGDFHYRAATERCFFGRVPFGNAILSRFPVERCAHVPLEVEEGDLALGGQARDFVDPRLFSAASIVLPVGSNVGARTTTTTTLGVCCAHLDQKSEELRERQMLRSLSAMAELMGSDTPHVFCGDLNTFRRIDTDDEGWKAILDLYDSRGWPPPRERSLVLDALSSAGYRDAFYRVRDRDAPGTLRPSSSDVHLEDVRGAGEEGCGRGEFPGPTCWTKTPLMRIDHIWTSPERPGHKFRMKPWRYSRILTDASDHFPVVVDLELVAS